MGITACEIAIGAIFPESADREPLRFLYGSRLRIQRIGAARRVADHPRPKGDASA